MAKAIHTDRWEEVVKLIKNNPGCTIVPWNSLGKVCFRIRDAKVNPLMNITDGMFQYLRSNDYIVKNEETGLWTSNN